MARIMLTWRSSFPLRSGSSGTLTGRSFPLECSDEYASLFQSRISLATEREALVDAVSTSEFWFSKGRHNDDILG
jgi:hypothetical protein